MRRKTYTKFELILDDDMIEYFNADIAGNFGVYVYSKVYGDGSIQYLKIAN